MRKTTTKAMPAEPKPTRTRQNKAKPKSKLPAPPPEPSIEALRRQLTAEHNAIENVAIKFLEREARFDQETGFAMNALAMVASKFGINIASMNLGQAAETITAHANGQGIREYRSITHELAAARAKLAQSTDKVSSDRNLALARDDIEKQAKVIASLRRTNNELAKKVVKLDAADGKLNALRDALLATMDHETEQPR